MTDTFIRSSVFAVVLVAMLFTFRWVHPRVQPAFSSAPSGLQAVVSSSSINTLVGGTVSTLFATSSCSARIITTAGAPITVTFSDKVGQTPTATFGILQGSSTSVVYDSGQFGCGLIKVLSASAQILTVIETQ